MEYPFEQINSVADCELLKREAQRDRDIADNKRINLMFQANQSAGTAENRNVDLQDAQTDLAKVVSQQAGETPNSVDWMKLEAKRKDLDARVYKLQLNPSCS